MRTRRIIIRGKRWRIVFRRPPNNKCAATCDEATRTIYIRPSWANTDFYKKACIIHEILHACFPDVDETVIEKVEEALLAGLGLKE